MAGSHRRDWEELNWQFAVMNMFRTTSVLQFNWS